MGMMTKGEIEKYLTQSCNMSLGNDAEGETSYTNAFEIRVTVIDDTEGFLFIPRLPANYRIDRQLMEAIYTIASAALYPQYTLLKQNNLYLVPLLDEDIHTARALFFPWKEGISKRLVIPDIKEFVVKQSNQQLPIMDNLKINMSKVVGIAIAGNSGAGKSYFLTYLLELLSRMGKLVIVDPKMDTPSRWGKKRGVKTLFPTSNRSKSDFVSQVNEELSNALNIVYKRQRELYDNSNKEFEHYYIVIDELLALSEGVNKAIKDSFFSLLSQIALLGRATNVHLILCSQRFDNTAIPLSVREQLNVLIQLGNISKRTTQFLFPDLDPSNIVIPLGKGTGLIQVIDSEHPYQVLPLLCPTYY